MSGSRLVVAGVVIAVASVIITVVSVTVDASPTGPRAAHAAGLLPFNDCTDLQRTMRRVALRHVTAYGLQPAYGGVRQVAGTPPGAAALPSAAGAAESRAATDAVGASGTGTNVQERGVDEPDLAKTDGRYVFTVSGDTLEIVDTAGGHPTATGALPLGARGGQPHELLLAGDRVLVLGTDPASAATRVTLVDVSEPADPRLVQTADISGAYVTAREHGGLVRLVVANQPRIAMRSPAGGFFSELDALADNRSAVRGAGAASWLPRVVVRDPDGSVRRKGSLLGCADVRHPEPVTVPALVTVLTVDPAGGLRRMPSRAVTAGGDLVYASASRLYVATGEFASWPVPAAEPGGVAPRPESGPRTRLHAFDISGDGPARYVASGSVDGWLLNRWAMSEHEGLLRVATTRERARDPDPPGDTPVDSATRVAPVVPATDSAVTVLAERRGRLVRVGQVGGLGRGETVHAVRWFGDLATVVTFRQTDPLYTVDLSDPRHPRLLGELKIPGFSAYLHPVGDDLLLGVGQHGDMAGRLSGLAVSLFDLADLARPRQVDVAPLGASWSPVMEDSRAFTYLPDRRLALVPAEAWPVTPMEGGTPGGAVAALRVGVDGALSKAGALAPGFGVRRVLPVGDLLAAVGDEVVVLYEGGGLTETGRIRLD